jgi:hypothetical protein
VAPFFYPPHRPSRCRIIDEPLAVSPAKAWNLLDIGNTRGYELIKSGELESLSRRHESQDHDVVDQGPHRASADGRSRQRDGSLGADMTSMSSGRAA